MTILGIDPGLASLGYAAMSLDAEVVELGVIRTKKSAKKLRVRAVDDLERRVGVLQDAFCDILNDHNPTVLCIEAFSPPRSSSVASKVAMVYGMLLAIARIDGIPVLSVSPQEVKRASCGRRNASKSEVAEALWGIYGTCDGGWVASERRVGLVPESQLEHAWDALAAIHACWNDPVVRAARRTV